MKAINKWPLEHHLKFQGPNFEILCFFIFSGRNFAHSIQYKAGAIGRMRQICTPGDAREDQQSIQAAFNACHDISIHPVSNDSSVL